MTAVWVYLALLLGLNRLGQRTLSLNAFPQDLSLGLDEVGRLAFVAFWIYAAGFAPVLLVDLANLSRLLMSLGLFLLGVLLFFGCLQACTGSCWPPATTTWNGPTSCSPAPTSLSGPVRWRLRPSRPSRRSPCRLPR